MSNNDTKMTKEYNACPVNSHNEWDPLEEVIIGNVNGAMLPGWDLLFKHGSPLGDWEDFCKWANPNGKSYSKEHIEGAMQCLEEFIHILESEGVKVRRIDEVDYAASYATPDWKVPNGFCSASPRDPFLIIGNEILETPMADRSRYFEAWAYRSLFKEYFKAGAKWTAAPKPQLQDALYDPNYRIPGPDEPNRFTLTEFEPVFDAADFVRCGRDIFGQMSHVTNRFGIEWLQRHLGDAYRVHIVHSRSREALHIDNALMPLAPGKVMVNPDFLDLKEISSLFKGWDILIAPRPYPSDDPIGGSESAWANMNVLMLDEERVFVEKKQVSMIAAMQDWGFKPIRCSFEKYYPFWGSFHCATLDIRRRGELKSYF